MGGVILDGLGQPLAPASVIADLQEIDPRLGLQYHAGLHAFVVTLQWRENDDRHRFIQEGSMRPGTDYDILFPIPTDVTLDEMRGWCAVNLRRVSQSNDDVRKMVAAEEERLRKHNDAIAETKLAEAREELAMSAEKKTIDVGKRRTRVK